MFLVPQKIAAPTNTGSSSSSISLRWREKKQGNLPKTYTVEWNPASVTGAKNKSRINKTFTTITGLQSNTAYNFTVAVVNEKGSSQISKDTEMYTGEYQIKFVIANSNS